MEENDIKVSEMNRTILFVKILSNKVTSKLFSEDELYTMRQYVHEYTRNVIADVLYEQRKEADHILQEYKDDEQKRSRTK